MVRAVAAGYVLGLLFAIWADPVGANVDCAAYLYIAYGDQTRLKDGSITQRYHIRGDNDSWLNGGASQNVKAYYRLRSQSGQGQSGYRQAPITYCRDDVTFEVNSRANALIDVYVAGTCGSRRWTAQTGHPLFGKASPAAGESPAGAGLPSGFGRLSLRPARHNQYMQTGKTYRFDYHGRDGTLETAAVFEDRKRIADLVIMPGNVLAYTPPHDSRLDRGGHFATKETVVRIDETACGRQYATTYTLVLHRSIGAHSRLLPGILLFGAAGVVVGILVNRYKRRSWYA